MNNIKLYISNDLEALAGKLATNLNNLSVTLRADYTDTCADGGNRSFNSVFQPFHVVSQTVGMDIWLKTELAQTNRLGIAANIRFLKPNDLISEMYKLFNPEKQQVFTNEQLQWVLYSLLNEPQFTSRFKKVAGYYASDDVKRMALAAQLADLFDQYQIYRYKELIEQWNKGPVKDDEGHVGWQSWLWHRAKEKLGTQMPDKTRARAFLLEQLDDSEAAAKLALAFPQVHLFGNSILAPFHTELLYKLSNHISVHLYFTNPAPNHYWLEDKTEKQQARKKLNQYSTGNTLMVGWGRVISNTLKLFEQGEVLFNNAEEVGVKKPGSDTLLQKLQHDIFENAVGDDRQELGAEDLADGSVVINSCYTPVREVEVLKDQLFHLIEKAGIDKQTGKRRDYLSPRDIVVMVPDIDAYAPYIDAVFGEDKHRLPFTVADSACSSGSTLLQAVETIFNIDEERCTAEELMQLLDFAAVRDRFDITDTAFLRRAVAGANIRFGLQGCADDDTVQVSWQNGMRRLLLGYCMQGVDAYAFNEGDDILLPLELAEGSEGLEVLRLWQFFKTLEDHLCQRKEKKTLIAWADMVDELVENLLCEPDKATGADHRQLAKWLEKLRGLNNVEQEAVSFAVFKHYFLSLLSSEKMHADYQHGGITFCSMIPMRSVPFGVVALLGMNNGVFPRKEQRLNFNLIDGRKPGDRNVRDNDKHLFLETLLSARENLYISYLGRSCKDNSALPPSILVDELLDYIESRISKDEKAVLAAKYKTVRSELVCQHPLHGFSKQYNGKNSRLFTYRSYKNRDTKQPSSIADDNSSKPPKTVVSIEEFISFFKHPIKAYYNKVLGIYYGDDEMLLPCTEKFELGTLDSWNVKNDLLKVSDDGYERTAVKKGLLPLKNMAGLKLQPLKEEVVKIKADLQTVIQGATPAQPITVSLPFDGLSIEGVLPVYSNNRMVVVSVSDSKEKYELETWLRYLQACAMGRQLDAYLVSDDGVQWLNAGMTQIDANSKLQELVALYLQGYSKPLPYYPNLFRIGSDKWAELEWKEFVKKRDYYFTQGEYYIFVDPYLKQEYKNGLFDGKAILGTLKENMQALSPSTAFQMPAKEKKTAAEKSDSKPKASKTKTSKPS